MGRPGSGCSIPFCGLHLLMRLLILWVTVLTSIHTPVLGSTLTAPFSVPAASRWCSCGQVGTPSRQPTSCSTAHLCSSPSVVYYRSWWTWPSWGRPMPLLTTPRSQHPMQCILPVPRLSEESREDEDMRDRPTVGAKSQSVLLHQGAWPCVPHRWARRRQRLS